MRTTASQGNAGVLQQSIGLSEISYLLIPLLKRQWKEQVFPVVRLTTDPGFFRDAKYRKYPQVGPCYRPWKTRLIWVAAWLSTQR
jgi:hypothetical protein